MLTWALIVLQLGVAQPERTLSDDLPSLTACMRQGAVAMLNNRAIRTIRCTPLMRA